MLRVTTPTLKIEVLGPLQDTSVEFGDVTFLVGEPNTGKSYILRALYSGMLHLDPSTLAHCVSMRLWRLNGLVSVKMGVAEASVEREGVLVRVKNIRLCISVNRFLDALRRALEDCIHSTLLPKGVKYSLAEIITVDRVLELEQVLPRLRSILYNIASSIIDSEVKVYSEGGRVCSEIPELQHIIRRRSLLEYFAEKETDRFIQQAIKIAKEDIEQLLLSRFRLEELLQNMLLDYVEHYGRIVYATYGRSLLTQALLKELIESLDTSLVKLIQALFKAFYTSSLKTIIGSCNLPALSLYTALAEGYKLMLEEAELAKKLMKIFQPLLRGRLKLVPGTIVYSSDGVEVPLHFASALAGETVGLMLASAPILHAGKGWLLVEEPEAQLHPTAQAVVPVVLYGLACEGVRLVVTTHSDIVAGVAAILASMAKKTPEKLYRAVKRLIDLFGKADEEDVEWLAKTIAEKLPRLDIRFYHVGDGKAKLKTIEEVVNEIPTLTETLWKLARWDLEII